MYYVKEKTDEHKGIMGKISQLIEELLRRYIQKISNIFSSEGNYILAMYLYYLLVKRSTILDNTQIPWRHTLTSVTQIN